MRAVPWGAYSGGPWCLRASVGGSVGGGNPGHVDVLKLEYVVPEDMPDSSFQPVAWGDWPREVLRYRVGVGLQERAHGLDCLLLRYRWVEALDVEAGQEWPW